MILLEAETSTIFDPYLPSFGTICSTVRREREIHAIWARYELKHEERG